MEDQERLQEERQVIESRQQQHEEAYRKERQATAHLSWRQRKIAMYKANKHLMSSRPSEKAGGLDLSLRIIVKGVESVGGFGGGHVMAGQHPEHSVGVSHSFFNMSASIPAQLSLG